MKSGIRPSHTAWRNLLTSLAAILLGFVFGAALILASGANPLEGFLYLFQGSLMTATRVSNTAAYAVPLILTGLSIVFSFKTGLFNIGAPGQMLMGGVCALTLSQTADLPRAAFLPCMIAVAIAGGAVWAAVPGLLKARFNVNEVVSGIMLNWTAYWIVYFVISENFKSATIDTESIAVPAAASLKSEWITELTGGSNLNYGVLIAAVAVVAIAFVLKHTVTGYEMKAVGYNRLAAEYGGISVSLNTALAMAISGALAGLAGLTYYAGYLSNIRIGIMPSQGFDGIAVALLANNSPCGVVLSALFLSALQTGKGYMNAMMAIPPEIADTIVAIIIYFSATSKLVSDYLDKIKAFVAGRFRRRGKEAGHVGNH